LCRGLAGGARWPVAGALLLLSAACAVAPMPEPLPALAGVPAAFELAARISVRQGDRGDIARLRWTHRADSDSWVVSSPLGNEMARIESGPRGARLLRADAPPEEAASFGELSRRLLGAELEPRELASWLHGASPRDAAGWRVVVEETERAGAVALARRLSAKRGDVVVKLVIDRYRALED